MSKTKNSNTEVQTINEEAVNVSGSVSKSQMMRNLYDDGMSVSQIAKEMGVRYQFAYQIINNYTGGQIRKGDTGPSKSDEFRQLFDEGKTVGEIAKATNSNYTFVFQVIKKYKAELLAGAEG